MSVEIRREGTRVRVYTHNHFESHSYKFSVYDTPDGKSVIVDDGNITDTVRNALEDRGFVIRDERPERYKWRGNTPTDSHQGKFTIQGVNGQVEEWGTLSYETDCGSLHTSTDLEVGATYETYRKDAVHFGYRKVD